MLVALCCCSPRVWADALSSGERPVHHLILALDWAPSPAGWFYDVATTRSIRELSQVMVRDGKGTGRPLLDGSDYFSCLAFRADVKNNTLQEYVQPISDANKPVVFQQNTGNVFASSLNGHWRNWLNCNPFEMKSPLSFSLLTVAKPFCLNYFAKLTTKSLVNRTFMIVVSDHIYNGDMYNEIINLRQYNHDNFLTGIKDDAVYPVYYDVNQSYFIRHLQTKEIKSAAHSWVVNGYAELFEFVPLQKHFQLASVLDFPVILKAKRVRGGKFRCDLSLENRGHAQYVPLKVCASVNGKLVKEWNEADLSKKIACAFVVNKDARPEKLHLASWVRLQDGIYNATVLSPVPSAIEEGGRKGLNVDLRIEYEEEATIFSMPMPDFMWLPFFPDNQYDAADVWEYILIIMIIIVVAGIVIRLYVMNQYFTPSVEDMNFKIERKR